MPTPVQIKKQIDTIISYLLEVGLADDQNFSIQRKLDQQRVEVTFSHAEHISIAMKDRSYHEVYAQLAQLRAFNVRLLDGALIQMMYVFCSEMVERHRLAFYPSPHLEIFQNNPEVYMQDEIFAEVVSRAVVPFPLRFDCDVRDGARDVGVHPMSHLTLGQYKNCRIPVSAPVTPYWFINFILRNFYHTAFNHTGDNIPKLSERFDECIARSERQMVHIQVPAGAR